MSDFVRVIAPHSDLGSDNTYHEWVTFGARVKADSTGRSAPRMWDAVWQEWTCNNGDCGGRAIVHDGAVQRLLDNASSLPVSSVVGGQ